MRSIHLLGLIIFAAGCAPERQSVDVILRNGFIYTMSSAQPKAQALEIGRAHV